MGKFLVSGGAGFIGSHLVDRLLGNGHSVVVLDNLSAGKLKNLSHQKKNKNLKIIVGSVAKSADVNKAAKNIQAIFHLAASADVRIANPEANFRDNVLGTFNLLEAARKNNIRDFVFSSSSAVYGDTNVTPTPEGYNGTPISIYGATKLAAEKLVSAYSATFGMKTVMLRFANIIGARTPRGVVYDFVRKLQKNSREMEILGDGYQRKSYLHVSDCVAAILLAREKSPAGSRIYNVGNDDTISAKEIAEVVAGELGLEGVKFNITGGVDGGRGWKGDVKYTFGDNKKLKRLGWAPKMNSAEAVALAAKEISAATSRK